MKANNLKQHLINPTRQKYLLDLIFTNNFKFIKEESGNGDPLILIYITIWYFFTWNANFLKSLLLQDVFGAIKKEILII